MDWLFPKTHQNQNFSQLKRLKKWLEDTTESYDIHPKLGRKDGFIFFRFQYILFYEFCKVILFKNESNSLFPGMEVFHTL